MFKAEYWLLFSILSKESPRITLRSQKMSWVVFFGVAISLTASVLSVWYGPNVPFLDDYHLCLDFLNEFVASGKELPVLFEKRNGHFFVTQKMIFILDYLLFGKVDFRHFVVINNVVFVSIFYIIYCILRNSRIEKIHFLPLLLIGCVPNFYLNNHSSSFLHFSSILFCLLAFLYLDRKSCRAFILASLFAILAALSSGGGLLVYFAALPLLWIKYERPFLLAWLLQFLILAVLYLTGHDSGSGGDFFKVFGISNWLILSGNFFLFFGSFFKPLYGNYHVWSLIIGMAGIAALTYVFWDKRKFLKHHPLLLSGLLVGLLLGFASTIMRSQYGLGSTTSDRYRLYQFIFWAFLYLLLVSMHRMKLEKCYPWVLIGSFLIYGLRMNRSVAEIHFRSMQLLEGMKYYQTFEDVGQLTYRDLNTAGRILARSKDLNIYSIEAQSFDLFFGKVEPDVSGLGILTAELDIVQRLDNFMHVEGWVYSDLDMQKRDKVLFFVEGNEGRTYYSTGPIITADNWLPVKDNSFSITIEGISGDERMGVTIYRTGIGVVGEQFVDLGSQ